MTKYIFFFRGAKPKNAGEGRKRQPSWDKWFQDIKDKVVDRGAAAHSLGVAGNTSSQGNLEPTTGYAVIEADSLDEAKRLASSCPIYAEGGVVEVARHVSPDSILAA